MAGLAELDIPRSKLYRAIEEKVGLFTGLDGHNCLLRSDNTQQRRS